MHGPGGAQLPDETDGHGGGRVDGQDGGADVGQHILLGPEADQGPVLPGRVGRDDARPEHVVRPAPGRLAGVGHGVRQPDQAVEPSEFRRRVRVGGAARVHVLGRAQEDRVRRGRAAGQTDGRQTERPASELREENIRLMAERTIAIDIETDDTFTVCFSLLFIIHYGHVIIVFIFIDLFFPPPPFVQSTRSSISCSAREARFRVFRANFDPLARSPRYRGVSRAISPPPVSLARRLYSINVVRQ